MKFEIVLFTLMLTGTKAFPQQQDYKDIREGITKLSCAPTDSLTVIQTIDDLNTVDTNLIESNLNLYYSDVGWAYYRLYLYTKDTTLVKTSIENYIKSDYHKPNVSTTYWQLSSLNYILDDCEEGKYYLQKFKSSTDKEYWREDQIKLMTKDCEN